MNISIKRTSKICLVVVNEFWVLLLGVKNEKLGIRLGKHMPLKRRQNLAKTDRGSYYKEEWLEESLDSKCAFYNVNESDNDDESYNENNGQQQLPEGFANSHYRIVTPILLQKLINDSAVCKHQRHCSRALLLAEDVSHVFANLNHIFQNHSFY